MDSPKGLRCQIWCSLLLFLSIHGKILCTTYQVGDLDAWGVPPLSTKDLYTQWSKYHNLSIGDSLFFLYPPSQDSVIQVSGEAYNTCNLKDPILYMSDGNSLFNITKGGDFYFISGIDGHCEKSQKLRISVYGNGSVVDADAPTTASAPSYPTSFGSIPILASDASSIANPAFFMCAAFGIFLSLFGM